MTRGRRWEPSWALPAAILAAQTAAFLWVFLQYPIRGARSHQPGPVATMTRAGTCDSIVREPISPIGRPKIEFPEAEPPEPWIPEPYRIDPPAPDHPEEDKPPTPDKSYIQLRLGGRRIGVARGGGTQGPGGTEAAVAAGLRWLARHQSMDGSWSAREPWNCGACTGTDPEAESVETTALSLLAYLGAGYTHLTRESYVDAVTGKTMCWGLTVKDAIKWLITRQDAGGGYSSPSGARNTRAESIAALALGEAWGITNSRLFVEAAEKSLAAVTSARRLEGGWGTAPRAAEADAATTAWALCAIRMAKANGCRTDAEAVERAHAWLDGETETAGESGARAFAHILTGADWCAGALIQVLRTAKTEPVTGPVDPDLWHWTTQALFHASSLDRPEWLRWNEGLKSGLVGAQATRADSCAAGSWAAPEDCPGGRLRATALNVLTLETYYRYPRRFCEPALR